MLHSNPGTLTRQLVGTGIIEQLNMVKGENLRDANVPRFWKYLTLNRYYGAVLITMTI